MYRTVFNNPRRKVGFRTPSDIYFYLAVRAKRNWGPGGVCVMAALVMAGCTSSRPHELWIPPRPLHADAETYRPADGRPPDPLEMRRKPWHDRTAKIEGPVDLLTAVGLTFLHNPELAAAGYEVLARDADAQQAGRAPNPRVGFSAENFAGPSGGPTLERQTLRLSQVIELRGKREKRQALASAEQRLSAWDYEQLRLDVAARVTAGFIQVVVDEQRIELARENLALALRAEAIVADRVKAELVPGSSADRAAVRVSLQKVELARAERARDASRAALAAMWGGGAGASAAGAELIGDLSAERPALPDEQTLRLRLEQNPAIARMEGEEQRRRAAVELARARATPDPTVGGGVRYFPDADDAAGVFEVSWPLPIRDRNASGILAARLRLAQVHELRRVAWAEAERGLAQAYAGLSASAFELDTLEAEALPAAQRAYRAAVSSFDEGQTDYLDVLDTERTLVEVRLQRLDAALAYHTAVAEIERLTGQGLWE